MAGDFVAGLFEAPWASAQPWGSETSFARSAQNLVLKAVGISDAGMRVLDSVNTTASVALLVLGIGAQFFTPLRVAMPLVEMLSPWLMRSTMVSGLYRIIGKGECLDPAHYLSLAGALLSLRSFRDIQATAEDFKPVAKFLSTFPNYDTIAMLTQFRMEIYRARRQLAQIVDGTEIAYFSGNALYHSIQDHMDSRLSDEERMRLDGERMLQALFRAVLLTVSYNHLRDTVVPPPLPVNAKAPLARFHALLSAGRADVMVLSADLKVNEGRVTLLELNDGFQSGYKGFNSIYGESKAESLIYAYLQKGTNGKPLVFMPQEPPMPHPLPFGQLLQPWMLAHNSPSRFAGNDLIHGTSRAVSMSEFERECGYLGIRIGKVSAQAVDFRSSVLLRTFEQADAFVVSMGQNAYPVNNKLEELLLREDEFYTPERWWAHYVDGSRFVQINHPSAIPIVKNKGELWNAMRALNLVKHAPETLELRPFCDWDTHYVSELRQRLQVFASNDRLILKPVSLSRGRGILIATRDELHAALENAVTRAAPDTLSAPIYIGPQRIQIAKAWISDLMNKTIFLKRYARTLVMKSQEPRPLSFDGAIASADGVSGASPLYFKELAEQYASHQLLLQRYVPSDPVQVIRSDGRSESYDGTMRIFFGLRHSDGASEFTPLGAYWKLPAKPLDTHGSSHVASLSRVDPHNPELPSSAPVDPDLYAQVVPQLEKIMLTLYPKLRGA